jgi:flagellar biosynthesis protein FliR
MKRIKRILILSGIGVIAGVIIDLLARAFHLSPFHCGLATGLGLSIAIDIFKHNIE